MLSPKHGKNLRQAAITVKLQKTGGKALNFLTADAAVDLWYTGIRFLVVLLHGEEFYRCGIVRCNNELPRLRDRWRFTTG